MWKVFLLLGITGFSVLAADIQSNILIYGEGDTQVSSELDPYQDWVEGTPLTGSIFVTHDSKKNVDINSFRLGDKPLKADFVRTVSMSSYGGNLELSIYSFKLEGLKKEEQALPPVTVNVGGKDYQAPPMFVELGS